MSRRNNQPKLNEEKAKQVILYLLNKFGTLEKTKLEMLLYYLDFDYYEKYEEHFMGFKYIK